MSHRLKTYFASFFRTVVLVFLALLVSYYVIVLQDGTKEARADSSNTLSGYAWSNNIGWISFSGSNYGITVDTNGKLSGYAWSDNIGWISANDSDLAGCPKTPCTAKLQSNNLKGWLKVLSGGSSQSGGWDGWISLSDNNPDYGPTLSNNIFSGYSWGSDVVGWISWSGSGYGVTTDMAPTATLSASPSTINLGQSSTLSWSSTNATSCTGTGFTAGGSSGTRSTGTLNNLGTSNYQVVCTGAGGSSAPAFASVDVVSPSVTISANPTRVQTGSNSQISWSASGVDSCTVVGPSNTLSSGSADASHNFSTGSPNSSLITSQSIFKITCNTNGVTTSKSVTVNVVAIFEEF